MGLSLHPSHVYSLQSAVSRGERLALGHLCGLSSVIQLLTGRFGTQAKVSWFRQAVSSPALVRIRRELGL